VKQSARFSYAQKYSPTDVSLMLHLQQHIYSSHIEKPTEWPAVCRSINQEKDITTKCCAHTKFSHLWHQSASQKWL